MEVCKGKRREELRRHLDCVWSGNLLPVPVRYLMPWGKREGCVCADIWFPGASIHSSKSWPDAVIHLHKYGCFLWNWIYKVHLTEASKIDGPEAWKCDQFCRGDIGQLNVSDLAGFCLVRNSNERQAHRIQEIKSF